MGVSRIALVWGDPGCGKTLALQAIAEEQDGIFITCDFHSASPAGLLEKIARAIRVPFGSGSRQAFETLVERLRGSGKLIVIDEIHALLTRNDLAFHTLRTLSDQTGCPQLWAATCDLITELRKMEHRRQPLAQIVSRIGIQVHLTRSIQAGGTPGGGKPLYSVEEVLKMYARNEMRLTRDAGEFLAKLCTNASGGLLRTCTAMVAHATVLYRQKAKEITPEMLWEAALLLFQDATISSLHRCVVEEVKEMKLRRMA